MQSLPARRVRIPRSPNRPEHRRAITLCRSGATFPPGLGGPRTGRGAVPTESAFTRNEQTTKGAGEGLRSAASRTERTESRRSTTRSHPFTSIRFHVLLNSLFKVLFNFPSRYLFAIGLGVIFSLTRSLPRTLSSTPKLLDSRESVSTAKPPPYGPITLYGPWPQSRWTWTGSFTARRRSQTPHSTRPRWPAVRCWALPVSFAITKGITVVFFSSAY